MISLTFGLAGLGTDGGGSYMRLIYSPFFLMPNWSGYVWIGFAGGHSAGTIGSFELAESIESTYLKTFRFLSEIDGKSFDKKFKIKFPLTEFKLINIEMRAVKVTFDEK